MSLQAWDVYVYTPQSCAGSVIWSHEWSSRVNHSLNYHSVSFIGFPKLPFALLKKKIWCAKVPISQRKDYFCCFSLETNNKVSTPWIRLISAVEKFLEGLYFTFNLFIWLHIYLCDKAAVGGRGKNWCSWVASWHWWPARTWSALTPAASQSLLHSSPAGLKWAEMVKGWLIRRSQKTFTQRGMKNDVDGCRTDCSDHAALIFTCF